MQSPSPLRVWAGKRVAGESLNYRTLPPPERQAARAAMIHRLKAVSACAVAKEFRCSLPTVSRWARRFRLYGQSGLEDRRSREYRGASLFAEMEDDI